MKDVIDYIIDAYRSHINNENEKRDQVLIFANTSGLNVDKWITFFEAIDGVDMDFEPIEKERVLENELRTKYKIFK